MARIRRFAVPNLSAAAAGARLALPADERQHARVLRLEAGVEIELFDPHGHVWRARLGEAAQEAELLEAREAIEVRRPPLWLATAWPKGKRAALLVEKASELGAARIFPLRCARSVVTKDGESEGVARLKRIAAEAAKQSGRTDVPVVEAERSFNDLLECEAAAARIVLLDPRAPHRFADWLEEPFADPRPWLVLVGPEGGFTDEEEARAVEAGALRARLGPHVLRVETAALAACAAWAARA